MTDRGVVVTWRSVLWLAVTSLAAARTSSASEPEWLRDVYQRSVDAVVVIEAGGRTGSGFFFHDGQWVVTALHVVDDAGSVQIEATSGARSEARVAAYSRAHDLALLRLEQPVPNAVVLSAAASARVGEPVAVIGHPFANLARREARLRGLLGWSLTQGIVGALSGSWLQTDAAVNPGNSGGPALNTAGEVLGVVSGRLSEGQGIGIVVRIARVAPLFEQIDRQPPPRHLVRWDRSELAFMVQWSDAALAGFTLGGGVRVLEHYPLQLRIGFVGGDVPPADALVLASTLDRLTLELSGGYALALGARVALSAQLGATLLADRRRDTSLALDESLVCDTSPCLVAGEVRRSTEHDLRLLPMLALTLDVGPLRAGYAYQLALAHGDRSQHRALAAFTF